MKKLLTLLVMLFIAEAGIAQNTNKKSPEKPGDAKQSKEKQADKPPKDDEEVRGLGSYSAIGLSVGMQGSYMNNKDLNSFIDNYNTNNAATIKEPFNHFNLYYGYELGFHWTILDVNYSNNFAFQSRELSGGRRRQFDIRNRFVSVLAGIRLGSKWRLPIGVSAVTSRLSAQMLYPNNYESMGLEYGISGTYEALALNGILGLERVFKTKNGNNFNIYAHYTLPIAGTASTYTDDSAGKGALGTISTTTSADAKVNFSGLMVGLRFVRNIKF